MRFISTRVHGVLDYLMGVALIAAPWVLGFANGGAAQWTPVIVGCSVLFYSLLTDYELGLFPAIPMPGHLLLDAVGGAVLAASPWLFGFSEYVWVPHLVVGLAEVAAALTTSTVPQGSRQIGSTGQPTAQL